MKVLFVSSGNNWNGITHIVQNQGNSLIDKGISLEYFNIKGKGIKGYLKASIDLRKFLKNHVYDIVHAHYSLSGFSATLAGARPLVVSLMGSDIKSSKSNTYLISFFKRFFWSYTIVKSQDMIPDSVPSGIAVIPNGVDLDFFKPIDKETALEKVRFSPRKKHVLFAADPDRREKNFPLAKKAFEKFNDTAVELHYLKNTPNELMPFYMNASDVVLLTSLWEGSPNVIKEAMACNRPVVSCNVGDVEKLLHDLPGCYLTSHSVDDVSYALTQALEYQKDTNGRQRLIDLKLDSGSIANCLIDIYKQVKPN